MSSLGSSQYQISLEGVLKERAIDGTLWCEVTPDWNTIAHSHNLESAWISLKPDSVWQNSDGDIIIAECYARVDSMKSGNRRKVATDILKLASLRMALERQGHSSRFKFMMIVPEELYIELTNKGWMARAASIHSVQIVPIKLTEHEHMAIRLAVEGQREGMKK